MNHICTNDLKANIVTFKHELENWTNGATTEADDFSLFDDEDDIREEQETFLRYQLTGDDSYGDSLYGSYKALTGKHLFTLVDGETITETIVKNVISEIDLALAEF